MRLYCDIDGVLTARPGSSPRPIERLMIGDSIVEWRVYDVLRLFDLFDEVVWATTWLFEPSALASLENYLGVSHSGVDLHLKQYVKARHPSTHRDTCGKLEAVRKHYVADPVPFMWLDDHMGAEDFEWARSVGGIAIRPLYGQGGMYAIFDDIAEEVETHGDARSRA